MTRHCYIVRIYKDENLDKCYAPRGRDKGKFSTIEEATRYVNQAVKEGLLTRGIPVIISLTVTPWGVIKKQVKQGKPIKIINNEKEIQFRPYQKRG